MSYTINLSNGNTLTTILDGTVDTSTTDLTLIGRNYTGFGEFVNQNTVKLLENFANSSPPNNPLIGQIWFDSAQNNIQVYTSTGWRGASGPIVSDKEPLSLVTGDFWIDSKEDQLYFYDGTNLVLAGPISGKSQKLTGPRAETVFDGNGNSYTILVTYIAEQIFSILSPSSFTPSPVIAGFTQLKTGLQLSSDFQSKFYSTVSNSLQLNGLTSDNYMRLDKDQITLGSFYIQNDLGLTVGSKSIGNLYVPSNTTQISLKNNAKGSPISLQTTDNNGNITDVLVVNGIHSRIGILNVLPQTELDVNGTTTTTNLSVTSSAKLADLTITTHNIAAVGTSANIDISLTTKGTGNIVLLNNPSIKGLNSPTDVNDATNKFYVDQTIKSSILSLTIIDNGLEADINGNTILLLNDIAPASDFTAGKIAFVHFQHIDFLNNVVDRYLRKYQITSGAWTFVENLTSSI
jgi:hypothetical protein